MFGSGEFKVQFLDEVFNKRLFAAQNGFGGVGGQQLYLLFTEYNFAIFEFSRQQQKKIGIRSLNPIAGHKNGHHSDFVQNIGILEYVAQNIAIGFSFVGMIGDQVNNPVSIVLR
nr:hypothetical protein [uncultured bacterium]